MRCAGCHNFNRHASAGKFNRDKIGVSDIDAKTNRRAVFAVLQPVFHDIAYQLGFAHYLAELVFFVVAAIACYV